MGITYSIDTNIYHSVDSKEVTNKNLDKTGDNTLHKTECVRFLPPFVLHFNFAVKPGRHWQHPFQARPCDGIGRLRFMGGGGSNPIVEQACSRRCLIMKYWRRWSTYEGTALTKLIKFAKSWQDYAP